MNPGILFAKSKLKAGNLNDRRVHKAGGRIFGKLWAWWVALRTRY